MFKSVARPARILVAIALALLTSCAVRNGEVVSPGAEPAGASPSRASFDTDVRLVVGSQIPSDRPLDLTITLGRALPTGSQIAISFPTAVQEETDALWSIPTTEAGKPGAVVVSGSAGSKVTIAEAGRAEGGAGRVVLRTSGDIASDDTVVLALTGQVPEIVPRRPFRIVEVDGATGAISEIPAENMNLPPVVPAPAATVILSMRSDAAVGAPQDLRLAALDPYGNVDTRYLGTLAFKSPFDGCPASYTFVAADAGLHTIHGLVAKAAGYKVVTAAADVGSGRKDVASDPVLVTSGAPSVLHLFGDPHFHSGSDVATLATPGGDHRGQFISATDSFAFLRDVLGLDWGASAEHDTGMTDATWLEDQKLVDGFDKPGEFVTLLGYEWTPPRRLGHHVVLYEGGPSPSNPLVGASSGKRGGEGAANYVELLDKLRAAPHDNGRVLVIPHMMQPYPNNDPDKDDRAKPHEIWDGPKDANGKNVANDLRRVAEIYSHHNDDFSAGDYRQTSLGRGDAVNQPQLFELGVNNPWSFQHAWSTGHRVGVIGGSDNHLGNPGLNDFAPTVNQHAGLAVVLAPERTRAAIFEALWERHCYATTGPRILLDFAVAGAQMGSELKKASGERLSISTSVAGTAPLASVEIVKLVNGDFTTIKTATLDGSATTATLAFDDAFDASTLYYVRVKQTDGEMAWSSPVWVDVAS